MILTERAYDIDQYIRHKYATYTDQEIADHLHISSQEVYSAARRIRARATITHKMIRQCTRMERGRKLIMEND